MVYLGKQQVGINSQTGIIAEPLNVTENGTYTALTGKAYSPVTVNVYRGIPIDLSNHINPATGQWERPSRWPDLDGITLPVDFDGVYLTYDLTKTTGYGWIGVKATVTSSAEYTVERGHLSGGTFVADESNSVASGTAFRPALDPDDGDVQLWRVTAANTITAFGFVTNSSTQSECINNNYQPCVEVRGRLKNITNFNSSNGVNPNNTCNGTIWCEKYSVAIRDGISSMTTAFTNMYSLQALDVSGLNLSNVAVMDYFFNNCRSLQTLDLSGWDVSKVTSMYQVFSGCWSLRSLDVHNWDVSKVVNLGDAFSSCYSLELLDVSDWEPKAATTLYNLFNGCFSLKNLDVSDWDTTKVTNMQNVFRSCESLQTLDLHKWDVSKATTMNSMFYWCYSLTDLDIHGWSPSLVTNVNGMFDNTVSLVRVNATGVTFTTSAVPDLNKATLTDYYPLVIAQNQSFNNSVMLTRASLLRIIDSLPTVTSNTLTLGQSNKNKLTAAEIAVATQKGWTVT